MKDRARPHDLNMAASLQTGCGKPYLPTHADRLCLNSGGAGIEDRLRKGLISARDHKDLNFQTQRSDSDILGACPCSACHSLAASTAAAQLSHGFRPDSKAGDPRSNDPAFYKELESSGVAAEGSFTDSAVGLESFGYDGHQPVSRKGPDLERSRTSCSPASPVPPGGFYLTKHFLPPFSEFNGFNHQMNAQCIKPSLAQKPSRLRHKKSEKHFPKEDPRSFSHDINLDFYSQDCVHCDQERKVHLQHIHQSHPNQLHHHHNPHQSHQRSKTPNGLQSPSLEDLDKSNESLARAEYHQNNHRDYGRRLHRGGNSNNNIYSCSSSSPERVYYPHSDSTPTSTPTSHLSSDAAAVTSVNLDSNISTSSITSHENLHNCSNSSSSRGPVKPGPTSTASSIRTRTTSRTANPDTKHRTFVLTSADIHSSQGEDKNKLGAGATITTAKSSPSLDQSESQAFRSSLSPANQMLVNGNLASKDNLSTLHPQVSLLQFRFHDRMAYCSFSLIQDRLPLRSMFLSLCS